MKPRSPRQVLHLAATQQAPDIITINLFVILPDLNFIHKQLASEYRDYRILREGHTRTQQATSHQVPWQEQVRPKVQFQNGKQQSAMYLNQK